jgi:glycosyltransferase involved in cell wall biosynthesis
VRLLLTTDTVGGVWTYALELADALSEHDVETTLAATGAPLSSDQLASLGRSRVRRVFAADYALEWMEDPWEDVERTGRWLLEIAAQVEPDVVHLNAYAHASLPFGEPVVVAGHSDVLSWHVAVRGVPAGPEWSRYAEVVRAGLAAADLLVAPTRAMLDELVRLYDPPCPRQVIPNGSSRPLPARAKEELVLSAGRMWDEAKNVDALVRVAPRLPWPVAVAGTGAVGDGVRALGPLGRDEMDAVLAAASIYAEPARYEPFGLAALEAARARCALVLGDIPSLREVWGDAALYVPPHDDDALERTLRSLVEHPERLDEYATRAEWRARAYSSARMAAAYVDAYRRVLHEPGVVAG